jgi:hypothetical protein
MYHNPSLRPGLAALVEFLMDRIYSGRSIAKIYDHAAVHGTLAGCLDLEPEHEADAEVAFVDALPAISADDPAWDDAGVYTDVESLLEPREAVPTRRPWSIESDREADRRRFEADPELAAIIRDEPEPARVYADCLPPGPISGGAPADDDSARWRSRRRDPSLRSPTA